MSALAVFALFLAVEQAAQTEVVLAQAADLAVAGDAVAQVIHGHAEALADIAGVDRLEAGAVRQNTRNHAAGVLGDRHAAEDQNDLSDQVKHIALKQHQIAVHDNGNEQQHHPHRDHSPEYAEALHHERDGPLLELSALIQRHDADERRRDQIEEYHIEDAGNAVEDDDRQIPDQLKRHSHHHDVVDRTHIEVGRHLRVVINALLSRVVGSTQRIVHGDVRVINGVARRPGGTHQEYQAIQRDVGADAAVLACIGAQRREGVVRPQSLHAVKQRVCQRGVINVKVRVRGQIRGVDDLLQRGLPRLAHPFLCHIIEIKNALLRQILQIRTDLVIAAVEVVAAVVGGIE